MDSEAFSKVQKLGKEKSSTEAAKFRGHAEASWQEAMLAEG